MKLGHLIVNHKHSGKKWTINFLGIPVYTKKYDNHHAYYSVLGIRILKKHKEKPQYQIKVEQNLFDPHLDPRELNIAIVLHGGLGDAILNTNFIWLLRQQIGYENIRIDVYYGRGPSVLQSLFVGTDYVNNLYSEKDLQLNKYDLVVGICKIPVLRYRNMRRILFLSPKLFDFVLLWIKDNEEKYRFIENSPHLDGLLNKYMLLQGIKRWEQFDVEHKLGMTEKFPAPLLIGEPEQKYLKKLKLPKKFITIHRGIDTIEWASSVKQWPFKYYNELIKLIRKKYPDLYIVQLGDSKDRCPDFDGVNVNLSGETSLEQLKILLKHSALHIDNEGGMVHIRHALQGGKSLVLFGPTDPNVYGYSENVNIVGKGCSGGCEWIRDNWQKECACGMLCPLCQESLTPDIVFKEFVKAWGKQ